MNVFFRELLFYEWNVGVLLRFVVIRFVLNGVILIVVVIFRVEWLLLVL